MRRGTGQGGGGRHIRQGGDGGHTQRGKIGKACPSVPAPLLLLPCPCLCLCHTSFVQIVPASPPNLLLPSHVPCHAMPCHLLLPSHVPCHAMSSAACLPAALPCADLPCAACLLSAPVLLCRFSSMPPPMLHVLQCCLEVDPGLRLTADEVLGLTFFDGVQVG